MLRFGQLVVSFPAVALLLAACNEINAPGPLQLTVAARPDAIRPGETTEIVVTARNISSGPVTFQRYCSFGFELEARLGGATPVTFPSGVCLAVYAPVTLQPLESVEDVLQWDGFHYVCSGTCVRAPVAAGLYRLTGGMRYGGATIRSAPVPFTVK
jgi:hypothetical protein